MILTEFDGKVVIARLINAAAGGYLSLGIQTLASLLMLPYLLSSHGIGLSGYGRVMAAMALAGMLGLATDGIRLAIAKYIGEVEARYRYRGFRHLLHHALRLATIIALAALSLIHVIGAASIIGGIGTWIWIYLICRFVAEQLSWVAQSYLQAERKVATIAITKSLETVLRSLVIVVVFENVGASVPRYVFLMVLFVMLRALCLVAAAIKTGHPTPASNDHESLPSIKALLSTAVNIQVRSIAYYIVYQGSVVVAQKAGSAELSGLVSLLLQTIRSYLTLAFVEAFRSSWLPLISGIIHENNCKEMQQLTEVIARWQGFIVSALFLIALFHNIWVVAWLGPAIAEHSFFFGVALIVYGAEIAGAMSNQLIMAAGKAGQLMRLVVTSLIVFILMQLLSGQVLGYNLLSILLAVFAFVLMENAIFIPLVAKDINSKMTARTFFVAPVTSAVLLVCFLAALQHTVLRGIMVIGGIALLMFQIRQIIEVSRPIINKMRTRSRGHA
jgi:O-antigen/teichoic acid export membrane protein